MSFETAKIILNCRNIILEGVLMFDERIGLAYFSNEVGFSKKDYYEALLHNGYDKTFGSFLVNFQKLINSGQVHRIGRNTYCVADKSKRTYSHSYSDLACQVAECITANHPYMDFVIFETAQLNEFINHQIGRNTLFIFAENDVIEFAFETITNSFPGAVMLSPGKKEFHRYRNDNSIVLVRLVSESPKNAEVPWHESAEKLLVDIMSEPLIKETFSKSEYEAIYEGVLGRYIVNESKMFRYARRRNVAAKIRKFINEDTSVHLKTEVI